MRITKPFIRAYSTTHPVPHVTDGIPVRPAARVALVMAPLPVGQPGNLPFDGMDPSDPVTYVRPWNPRGGMIAYLNFDGAALQSTTPSGGLQRGRQQRRRG